LKEKVSPHKKIDVKSEMVSPLQKKEEFPSSSSSLEGVGSRKEELQSPEKIVGSRESREERLKPSVEKTSPKKNTEDYSSSNEPQLQNTKNIPILTLHYENDKKLPRISSSFNSITPIRRRTYIAQYNTTHSDNDDESKISSSIIKKSIKTLQSTTSDITDDGKLSPILTQSSPPRITSHKSSDDGILSSPKLTQYSPPRTGIKSSPQHRNLSLQQNQYASPKLEVSTTRSLIHSDKVYNRRSEYLSDSSVSTESVKTKNRYNRDSGTKEKKYISSDSSKDFSSSTESRKRDRYKRDSTESRKTDRYKRDSGTKEKKYISKDSRKTDRYKSDSGTKEKKYISKISPSSTEARKSYRYKRESRTKEKKIYFIRFLNGIQKKRYS